MASDNGTINTALDNHILRIHVDREDKMNGFTPEMFDQLAVDHDQCLAITACLLPGIDIVVISKGDEIHAIFLGQGHQVIG